MKRLVGLITLIAAVVPWLWAGQAKEYPLTLIVLETYAISSQADGTRTTTICTGSPGSDEITCDSRQISGAMHTELVSFVEASDGKTYFISCIRGTGTRFAQGFAAGAGAATVSGCRVPAGTYKARWDKDRLKVLHEKDGKSKEATFAVLSSADVSTEKAQNQRKQARSTKRSSRFLPLLAVPTLNSMAVL